MTYYGKGSEMDFLRGQDVEDADELIQEYCTHPFFSKAWVAWCRGRHHPIYCECLRGIRGLREDRRLARRLLRGLRHKIDYIGSVE